MTLSAANRIQSGSGLFTGTAIPVTLPNPTIDGSTLLLLIGNNAGTITIGANQSFDPPWFQEQVHSGQWVFWRRDNQPRGETSWTITASISAAYYWRAEEWSGLATIGNPDSQSSIQTTTASLVNSTGNAPQFTTPAITDVNDYAALAVFRVNEAAGGLGWPAARSYSSGWSEVDWLISGDGTHTTDYALVVAEAYPGAAGTVICTVTFDISGGGTTPNACDGWCVCYQSGGAPAAGGVLAAAL